MAGHRIKYGRKAPEADTAAKTDAEAELESNPNGIAAFSAW